MVAGVIIGVFGIVICLILMIANGVTLGNDIGAPLNRAQTAAKPEDMDKYMALGQKGMEQHGLTSGHWNWFGIGTNVNNDFAVAYQQVTSVRERLVDVKKMSTSSPEYQQGMDDMRGTIRELTIGQQDWNQYRWFKWMGVAIIVGGFIFLVGLAVPE